MFEWILTIYFLFISIIRLYDLVYRSLIKGKFHHSTSQPFIPCGRTWTNNLYSLRISYFRLWNYFFNAKHLWCVSWYITTNDSDMNNNNDIEHWTDCVTVSNMYSIPLAATENWVVVLRLIVWLIKIFPMGTLNSLLSMNIWFFFRFLFQLMSSKFQRMKRQFFVVAVIIIRLFGNAKSEWSILMSWLWSPVRRMHLWN